MKPYVRNIETGAVERLVRRRLSEADMSALLISQRAVTDASGDESLYLAASEEDFLRVLSDGELWGFFAGGRLAAAFSLLPPGRGDGLAEYLDIPDNPPAVSELDRYFVTPEYRRNGLGSELVRFAKRRAFALGARSIAATVSPRNRASIRALVSDGGFRIRRARMLYGGKLRYIAAAERDDDAVFTIFERFALEDVYGITKMLARGYEGCATYYDEGGSYLWVAKQ